MGVDGNVVEREHYIQSYETRVMRESSDINHGIWFRNMVIKEKMYVFEMICLRNICGIRRVDRIKTQ